MQRNHFVDLKWEVDHKFNTQLEVNGSQEDLFFIVRNAEDLDLHIHELKQIAALFERQ